MKAKSFYHAIEMINPSQGAELTGSGRGVVDVNNRDYKYNFKAFVV